MAAQPENENLLGVHIIQTPVSIHTSQGPSRTILPNETEPAHVERQNYIRWRSQHMNEEMGPS